MPTSTFAGEDPRLFLEEHLGNHPNVAIHKDTFGGQAEAACQNDHRDDLRSVFAWMFD
ncbi:MAG: hypothetical protein OXG11_11225 [Chloroflexi bacterium]|nr:hypothetical protein [Chloroflexota bacterium]